MIAQPEPDPARTTADDGQRSDPRAGRRGRSPTQYAPDEVAEFLTEEGIPPAQCRSPEGTTEADAHAILAALWRWGSEGRRTVRRFLGRWLDDRLLSGPDAELRARLIEQLARQGWRVREADSVLVISEPVRGIPVSAPFLRASRLHPLIEAEARDQFLINKPEQGVFASMRAVEIRVRKLAGLGDEVIGIDLMNRAFGPGGPLTDLSAVKGEQEGTRLLFAGAYAVLRNPAGHRQVDYARPVRGRRGRAGRQPADADPRPRRGKASSPRRGRAANPGDACRLSTTSPRRSRLLRPRASRFGQRLDSKRTGSAQ